MTDLIQEPIVFEGKDPKECEAFIGALRRTGLAQGKLRDNDWMAGLASGYLAGEALYWFESLEECVQNDWSFLRPALLARFGRSASIFPSAPGVGTSVSLAAIPIPAAAPPLSATPHMRGVFNSLCSDAVDALSISFSVSPGERLFEIQLEDGDVLGISWGCNSDSWEQKEAIFAECCSWSTVTSTAMTSVKNWTAERKVWAVAKDGELLAQYPKKNGSFVTLRPFLGAIGDFCWRKFTSVGPENWQPVKVMFEEAV